MDPNALNSTELAAIIRQRSGLIVKRCVSHERLVELVTTGQAPNPDEVAGTAKTREVLQSFIEKQWTFINSQLPCTGPTRGKCTIHPCPEGRHVDCYTGNLEAIRLHVKIQ